VDTWHRAQILAIGAILCMGKVLLPLALKVIGLGGEIRFANFHRVLNRAKRNTFIDVVTLIRRQIWSSKHLVNLCENPDFGLF
jgi:hypothetical protein